MTHTGAFHGAFGDIILKDMCQTLKYIYNNDTENVEAQKHLITIQWSFIFNLGYKPINITKDVL